MCLSANFDYDFNDIPDWDDFDVEDFLSERDFNQRNMDMFND